MESKEEVGWREYEEVGWMERKEESRLDGEKRREKVGLR